LDEGSANVVVTDDAEFERNARSLAKANGSGRARIRNRHDDVGVNRVLAGEFNANLLAHRVDVAALDRGVRAGEVDVFEDAEPRLLLLERVEALDSLAGDDHHLARLDVADE